jgi:hypothetical protein
MRYLDAVRGASKACDQAVGRAYCEEANERGNEEMRPVTQFLHLLGLK